jgi:hypothetical protein
MHQISLFVLGHFDPNFELGLPRIALREAVRVPGVDTLSNSSDCKRQLSRRHILANLGIDQMGNKTHLSDSSC